MLNGNDLDWGKELAALVSLFMLLFMLFNRFRLVRRIWRSFIGTIKFYKYKWGIGKTVSDDTEQDEETATQETTSNTDINSDNTQMTEEEKRNMYE